MKTKNFMLEAKARLALPPQQLSCGCGQANKDDYESKIEEQECQLERLDSSMESYRERLAEVQAQEQAAKDVLTKYQGMVAKVRSIKLGAG